MGPKDDCGEGASVYGEGERGGGPIELRCEGAYGDEERGGGPVELLYEGVYGDGERGGGPMELRCEGDNEGEGGTEPGLLVPGTGRKPPSAGFFGGKGEYGSGMNAGLMGVPA